MARRGFIVVHFSAALLTLLAFITILAISGRAGGYDDAYITYVFARNIAEGHGFVWFAGGPHVYGSTTLTYTLLLALAVQVGSYIPTASIILGGLSWAAVSLVLFYLLKRTLGPLWGLLGMVLGVAMATIPVIWSVGLETGFYTLLVFVVFALYAAGRARLALLLGAVVVLTRLDGALAPALVFTHLLLIGGRDNVTKALKATWPSVLVLLASTSVLTWYFGNPLPQSFVAKLGFSEKISGRFAPSHLLALLSGQPGPQPLWLAFFALATLGIVRALLRWRDPSSLIVLWIPSYMAAYYFSGMPDHRWYYAPAIPALCAAFAWGASWPLGSLRDPGYRSFPLKSLLVALRVALLAIGAAIFVSSTYYTYKLYSENPFGEKIPSWDDRRLIAHKIVANMERRDTENATVVAYEVGYIGWVVPGKVYDIVGLVSPDALEHGGYKNPMYLIEAHDPDYIAIRSSYNYRITKPILRSHTLHQNYRLIFAAPRAHPPTVDPYWLFAKKGR